MTDDKMDRLSGANTEDEIGIELLVFIVIAAAIALAVAHLPVVAQVIAFFVVFKWLMTKIFR